MHRKVVQPNIEQNFKKVERPAPFTSASSITTEPLPSTSAASTTQLLHHLINTVLYSICFYSCDMELFSVFLIKYFFALFVHFITVQYDMYESRIE